MQEYLTRKNGKKVPQCQEPHVAAQGGWRFYQCKKAAMPGSRFCRQHDPEEVKKREAKRQARYDAKRQKRRVEFHGHKFLAALQKIADGHNDPRQLAIKTLEGFKTPSPPAEKPPDR